MKKALRIKRLFSGESFLRLSLVLCFLFACLPTGAGQVNNASVAPTTCQQSKQKEISLGLRDKEGRFVDTLRPEDLSVTINNNPAEVLKLQTNLNHPLSVVILVDTSMSQQFDLMRTRLAAYKFVEWVLRTTKDSAALVTFSGEAIVEQELTNDSYKLLGAISRVKLDRPADYSLGGVGAGRSPPIKPRRQGTTAIWDAVWASADGILKSVTGTRRVIMLMTDGDDSSSRTGMQQAIEYAASLDVSVFSIGTRDPGGYYLVGRHVLTELSEETGGRAFFLKKVEDLPEIFLKIEQELRSHYLLTYCATDEKPAGSPPKLKIEIRNPQLRKSNLRLSYRRYSF